MLKDQFVAAQYIRNQRKMSKTVVLVTGCFDLLHIAHCAFLRGAKTYGDILVVGIEDDNRVREFKGTTRPVNSVTERVEVLKELSYVDLVFIIKGSTSEPLKEFYTQLYGLLKPDILAIGVGDLHHNDRLEEIESAGGHLDVVESLDVISTTSMLKRMVINSNCDEIVYTWKRLVTIQQSRGQQERSNQFDFFSLLDGYNKSSDHEKT